MAVVTKATSPGPSTDTVTGMKACNLAGDLYAGEAIGALDSCYIKNSDGKVYRSNGTAANEAARCHGFAPVAYAVGEAVTLMAPGTRFRYATGLTPGQPLYVAATAGALDTGATTGGTSPVAFAVSASDVQFARQNLAP